MAEMFRINTRVSVKANEWLDRESETTGIPKSVLVLMAVEQFIQQREVMSTMADMGQVVEALEKLESKADMGQVVEVLERLESKMDSKN